MSTPEFTAGASLYRRDGPGYRTDSRFGAPASPASARAIRPSYMRPRPVVIPTPVDGDYGNLGLCPPNCILVGRSCDPTGELCRTWTCECWLR